MKKIFTSLLILFIFSFTGIGCVEPGKKHDAWQPVEPKKASFVHMVQWSGETLPIISKWYTGDSSNWQFIADANPNINPERLSAGSTIFIAEDLLKTRKPMPREFIAKYYHRPKKQTPPSKAVSATPKKAPAQPVPLPKKEGEFEIYGPK